MSLFRREPSQEEIAAATSEIAQQESALSFLERKVESLIAEIGKLRLAQRKHHEAIRHYKGIITLARRIPEELLAKIFEHCVADGWTRAPIVVSHVCSAWRKAAMAPRVWSYVYLDAESIDALGRTRFWLQRARQAPLHVHLVASWRTPNTQLVDTIVLLRRRASQWAFLKVDMDWLANTRFAISNFTRPMPMLREVEIQTQSREDGDAEESLALDEVFSQDLAPNLSHIHFSCNILPTNLRLPTHITSLHLNIYESPVSHPLANSALVDLLERLSGLETLTVQLPLVYEAQLLNDDIERTVDLPNLRSLTLYGPTDLNGLLAHIRAHNLRELHLRSLEEVGYRQEPLGPTLTQFLDKSQPSLELLELHDIDLSPETFEDCFWALPDLRTLRLHESSISDDTLRLLSGGDAMCPKLTHLDLRWCSHLGGRALVDLVRDRQAAVRDGEDVRMDGGVVIEPITELGILNCCFVEEQAVLQLARMTTVRLSLREDDYCREYLESNDHLYLC